MVAEVLIKGNMVEEEPLMVIVEEDLEFLVQMLVLDKMLVLVMHPGVLAIKEI